MGLDAPLEWIECVDDVMAGRNGPENFRILKRRELRFGYRSRRLSFSDLIRSVWVLTGKDELRSKTQDAPHVEDVSIVWLA